MGGRKRSKFERIYSESETDSTDEELNSDSPSKPQNVEVNENNSNSMNTSSSQNTEKFLVTRSKRKYNKPVVKISDKTEQETEEVMNSPPKKKRETIKSLNSKIQSANDFLNQLNKKLEDRDKEINSLKQVITKDRAVLKEKPREEKSKEETAMSGKVNSEMENLLNPGRRQERIPITLHDFPILQDIESEDEDLFPESTIDDPEEQDEHRSELARHHRRKRSRSRSRENRRDHKKYKESKRSRSRSGSRRRSRERDNQNIRFSEINEKHYREDPMVQQLVQKLVKEQVQQQVQKELDKRNKLNNTSGMNSFNKSPSDTILYTPAVAVNRNQQNLTLNGSPIQNNQMNSTMYSTNTKSNWTNNEKPSIASNTRVDPEAINDTLSQLRLISGIEGVNTDERRNREQIKDARSAADNTILQAERFKARIQQPNRGKEIQMNNSLTKAIQMNNSLINTTPKCNLDELRAMRYLESEDDEFFHTTCHIEANIREKIEKGKFVELDKLIQKKILQYNNRDESRMQLVNKDGISYFVPSVDRECRIDSIKKWEQAFRVYTTIYCKANPLRAGEILQYVDVIHRAAAIFNWDNVAKYDYVFRQLMAEKPHRSWAKVYTQMWNITLNEPIKKFNENSSYNGNNSNNSQRNSSQKEERYFLLEV